MGTAHIRLLGAVRFVTDRGEVIDLPSAAQRRLLAALAVAGRTTQRIEHLSDTLELSTGSLRTTVSRLRSRIGDDLSPGTGLHSSPGPAARVSAGGDRAGRRARRSSHGSAWPTRGTRSTRPRSPLPPTPRISSGSTTPASCSSQEPSHGGCSAGSADPRVGRPRRRRWSSTGPPDGTAAFQRFFPAANSETALSIRRRRVSSVLASLIVSTW